MPWNLKPIIFTEDGEPATNNATIKAEWAEEQAEEQIERTCPWCGLLCESVEALAEHEEGCDE